MKALLIISSPNMPRARVITENVKSFSHRWFSLIDSVLINPTVDALISAHQFIIHGPSEYKESERLCRTTRPAARRVLEICSFYKYPAFPEIPAPLELDGTPTTRFFIIAYCPHTPTGISTQWPHNATGKMWIHCGTLVGNSVNKRYP